jgi:hypothetical protein
MKIFLNVDGGQSYQYVLNHHTRKDGTTTLGRMVGEGDDLACVDVQDLVIRYEVRGDVMRISVPRKAVGLDRDNFTLWFKVADSREKYHSIEDFYDKGDVAPLGRLNFVYRGE